MAWTSTIRHSKLASCVIFNYSLLKSGLSSSRKTRTLRKYDFFDDQLENGARLKKQMRADISESESLKHDGGKKSSDSRNIRRVHKMK